MTNRNENCELKKLSVKNNYKLKNKKINLTFH